MGTLADLRKNQTFVRIHTRSFTRLTERHFTALPRRSVVCLRMAVLFGARGSVVVKALCYKPEARGFDTR
jgi:hypothetical protein